MARAVLTAEASPPAWCARFIGLPWVDHGRDWFGVDCYGLGWLVVREMTGIDLPRYPCAYPSARDAAAVKAAVDREIDQWAPVEWGDERPFDFAEILRTLRTAAGPVLEPLHTGVIVAPGWMLECDPVNDTQLTRYPMLRAVLPRFRRHRSLADR